MADMTHHLRQGIAGLLIGLAATTAVFWAVRAGRTPPVPTLIVIDPTAQAPKPGFAEDRMPAAANPPAVDGDAALAHLKALCAIGSRVSGSTGMKAQQELVVKHFEANGATVRRQAFTAAAASRPNDKVAMVNLIASWHPDRPRRVILCSHYDTRPAAHEEPNRADWNRPFASANDGTSGVALFMELARHLNDLKTPVGVDVVLFDGEEYILDPGVPYIRDGDKFFHGSQHFGRDYAATKGTLKYRYEAAVLLDLFAHDGARLAVEGYSQRLAPQLVADVWKTAEKLGATSFKFEQGFARGSEVQDDHLALNAAGIPAVDVLDFDYPHWHKLSDTPDKCSAKQLAEVGRVLLAWVQGLK